ncbi:acyltransferase [Vibrio gallicus]|uniref:acyltransferase n=1 Tax=Vibrio gallicus TaxID=190897 RepID=UPI0021C39756|nr:acyltransferase family protein [Vibrio gallicus]
MNKSNQTRLLWADNLRVLAVLAVITLHVASDFISDIDINSSTYGAREWWAGNLYASLTLWCIPLFIILSGYLLLNKRESNTEFFKKRLRKILIPLIFWSLFYSLWLLLKHHLRGDLSSAYFTVAKGWALGEPYYHLWYLFMIPFLYLVTPLLRVIVRSITQTELALFTSVCFALAALSALTNVILLYFELSAKVSLFTNDFLSYLGYFCLGGYVARYGVKTHDKWCAVIIASTFIITLFGSYYLTHLYFYSYLSLNIIALSICLFFILKKHANIDIKLHRFANLSFGIYLIHPLFIKLISTYCDTWLRQLFDIYLYIPIVACFTFALSYLTALGMSKIRYLKLCI